jgi:hypothetical protein
MMRRQPPSPAARLQLSPFFSRLILHSIRYYNPDNWKKQAKNYFGDHKSKMLLCAHPAKTVLSGLTKLVSPTSPAQ